MITTTENGELRLDIINAFGADLNLDMKENLEFVSRNNYIIYPVAHHLLIRDITVQTSGRINNNLNFIYLEQDLVRITSMNVSSEKNIVILCEEKTTYASISLYYLERLTFESVVIFKPRRKIMTDTYFQFKYASFCPEGNILCTIAKEKNNNKVKGLIYDLLNFLPFKMNYYKAINTFELPEDANKISFERKMICTSGKNHIGFWMSKEGFIKEYKCNAIMTKDYIDHSWVIGRKPLTLIALTNENEFFVIEGIFEKTNKLCYRTPTEEYIYDKIDKFIVKQHVSTLFKSANVFPSILRTFNEGIVIGSNKGDLLFVQKQIQGEGIYYEAMKLIQRKKEFGVTGLTLSYTNDHLAMGFSSNEIAYMDIRGIFNQFKSDINDMPFNILCEGFHGGKITAVDISVQRPIIITVSNQDKTVRVWNYITGHCEYCQIVLLENDQHLIKGMNIVSIALHPNGYYVAIADQEVIWFFHLCFKELRFYGTDRSLTKVGKGKCSYIKFSNGGHLLAAIHERQIYLLKSFTRETMKIIYTNHTGSIITVLFSPNDDYLYSIGSDGFIFQFNLFTFQGIRMMSQYVNYLDGNMIFTDNDIFSILACGLEGKNYAITELDIFPPESDDNQIIKSQITRIPEQVSTIISIRTKKYDIIGIAYGTENGIIGLLKYPYHSTLTEWDKIKSHSGRINKLIFNRETNLMFSIGNDGNIFVYCIYEYVNGDLTLFRDCQIANFSQLNTILDEGLGDNALFPLEVLQKYEDDLRANHELICSFNSKEALFRMEHDEATKFRLFELNKKHQEQINTLNETIEKLRESNIEIVKEYEEKISKMIIDQKSILNSNNSLYQQKVHELNNEVETLRNQIIEMKAVHEKTLDLKNTDFLNKFRALEKQLKERVEIIEREKVKLNDKLNDITKENNMKLIHFDKEHELENMISQEKHKKEIDELNTTVESQQYEVIKLIGQKSRVEVLLSNKEKECDNLNDQIETMRRFITKLKQAVENHETDKENLSNHICAIEKTLQEKDKSEAYANMLKNELYKKNVEVSQCFYASRGDNIEVMAINKALEKSINNSISLVTEKVKENQMIHIKAINIQERYDNLESKFNVLQNNIDEILTVVYDAFHSTENKMPENAIKHIYKNFLNNDEVCQTMKKKKLNIDIRQELENQINCLEKSLQNASKNQKTVEGFQNGFRHKKITENASLISGCTNLRMKNIEVIKEVSNLKSVKNALEKRIDNINKEVALSNHYQRKNLPQIGRNNSMPDLNLFTQTQNSILQQIKGNYNTKTNFTIDSSEPQGNKTYKKPSKYQHCISIKKIPYLNKDN